MSTRLPEGADDVGWRAVSAWAATRRSYTKRGNGCGPRSTRPRWSGSRSGW